MSLVILLKSVMSDQCRSGTTAATGNAIRFDDRYHELLLHVSILLIEIDRKFYNIRSRHK